MAHGEPCVIGQAKLTVAMMNPKFAMGKCEDFKLEYLMCFCKDSNQRCERALTIKTINFCCLLPSFLPFLSFSSFLLFPFFAPLRLKKVVSSNTKVLPEIGYL